MHARTLKSAPLKHRRHRLANRERQLRGKTERMSFILAGGQLLHTMCAATLRAVQEKSNRSMHRKELLSLMRRPDSTAELQSTVTG